MKKAMFSVIIVTAYLIVYVSFISLGKIIMPFYMLIGSPFLIIWMIWTVLRDPYKYVDLEEGEEWGYRDRPKEEFDIF